MTTSINFHLRPSQAVGRRPGKLFIRVIHARKSRHIPTDYALYPEEWDPVRKKIVMPKSCSYPRTGGDAGHLAGVFLDVPHPTLRREVLTRIGESMRDDLECLRRIVSNLSESGPFTAADIASRFADSRSGNTVRGYAVIIAHKLREAGRERTARAYISAARSLAAFTKGADTLLSRIDAPLAASYERWLLDKGLNLNTVSFYLRNLRALYFRAVAEKIIPPQDVNPFAGTHTGVYRTRRRALDDRQLNALARLGDRILARDGQTPEGSNARLHDSLLYFMFCYHARGMSFVDMAHLRRQDVGTENFTYRRRKTGGLLEVAVTEPMRRIISHFSGRTEGSDYLFPIVDPDRGNPWRQYETGLKRQNRSLKTLAAMAGIREGLSTHAARHTWATLAKRLHISTEVIGEALGHRDVKTTSIYLASFERSTMDELSRRMSEAVRAA